MPNYDFDTITRAEALALTYDDTITTSHGTASQTTVIYNANQTVTVTINDVTVTFGTVFSQSPTISQSRIAYPDQSTLYVGDATANNVVLKTSPSVPSGAVYGGDGADRIEGPGNWLVQGNQGDDYIYLSGGANTVYGGQGDDRITMGNLFAAQVGNFVQGNKGEDSIVGSFKADTLLGGQGNDTLIGGDGGDFVNGNLGNDFVAGDGVLRGEGGDDTLSSRFASATTLLGGDGDDQVVVGGGYTNAGAFNFGGMGSGPGAAGGFAFGEDGNDTIQGNSGADTLMGGAGNDSLESDSRNAQSSDLFDGGDGSDTLSARDGANVMRGGAGTDRLIGGSGTDTLDGGAGMDRMFGGAGADLFILRDSYGPFVSSGIDQINDWAVEDRIQIRTAAPTYTEMTAASFEAAQSAADGLIKSGTFEVVAIQVGADVYLFVDGSGDDTLFSVASLVGRSLNDISAANFI